MTQLEFGEYYTRLSAGNKGIFTAFLSVHLGGSPHSWQQKLLEWSKGNVLKRPMSPLITNELTNIIRHGIWKSK